MELKRISQGEIPPSGKYVLIYVATRPWEDSDDPENVFWKVAKCVHINSGTKDKYGNPELMFDAWGPDTYHGREVELWCELPSLEPYEINKICTYGSYTDKLKDDYNLYGKLLQKRIETLKNKET